MMTLVVVCLVVFAITAVLSKGKANGWSAICTLSLLTIAAAYTGLIGSILALFN